MPAPAADLKGEARGDAPLLRPRGRNLRWVIIAVIWVLSVTSYLDRGNLSVAAPVIMKDFGLSNTTLGLILSAFVWPYAIMNLPSGWLVDRFGTRLTLSIAAGLWSVVSLLTGFATSVAQFVGLRIALGAAEAPLFPAALKATNAWFPDREKALATSVYISGTQIGLAASPPISTALMLAFGWQAMFIIVSAFGALGLVGWMALYREPAHHPRLSREELTYIRNGQIGRAAVTQTRAGGREWLSLFAYRTVWTMIVASFCSHYTYWLYITWLPTYLSKAQHFSLSKAGWIAALPFIAGTVGTLLGGRISDIMVVRGVAPFTARRVVVAVALFLNALAMVGTVFSTNPAMAVVMLTLGMFTFGISGAVYWALATDVLTTSRFVASVASIQNFGGFLGGAFAPMVTGYLVDRFGGFDIAIGVAGAFAFVSSVLYGFALKKRLPL